MILSVDYLDMLTLLFKAWECYLNISASILQLIQ